MKSKVENNIYKLYIIKFSKWFMLFMPILIPFYKSCGIENFRDIMILKAIYSLSTVALEIPSGYFADVIGRKKSLVMGCILGSLGFLVYVFSSNFWLFACAEIILGVGASFISGSDSALLFDSLKASNKEKEYVKHEGRISGIGNFSEALAGIAASILVVNYGLKMPLIMQTVIAFTGIPAALLLVEPSHSKLMKGSALDLLKVVVESFTKNIPLRWILIYSSIIGASTLSMAYIIQLYFEEIKLNQNYYGYAYFILNSCVAFSSFYAYRLKKYLSKNSFLLSLSIIFPLSYVGVGIWPSTWALTIIIFFYFARGFAHPVLKEYINDFTSSEVRATVLSIRTFMIRIGFSILGPVLGWYYDIVSFSEMMIFAGLTFLIASSSIFIFLKLAQRK